MPFPPAVQDLIRAADTKVVFRSTLSPELVLYEANAPVEPSSPFTTFVNGLLQPAVVVESELGDKVIAPYGLPKKDYRPLAYAAGTLLVGLALYGAFDLAYRFSRR